MNDEEIDRTLRRFRLVARPPTVRATIVQPPRGRVVPTSAWMPTVAALLTATIFYGLSASERAVVRITVDGATAARAADVELVARSLGGGPQSLSVARTLVLLDEPKIDTTR